MNKLTFLGIFPTTLGIAYTSVSGGVTYIYTYSNTNCISEIIPHVENSFSDLVIEIDGMIQIHQHIEVSRVSNNKRHITHIGATTKTFHQSLHTCLHWTGNSRSYLSRILWAMFALTSLKSYTSLSGSGTFRMKKSQSYRLSL